MADSLSIEGRQRSEQCHSARVILLPGPCYGTYAPGMDLQSRDVVWTERIRKGRENASGPGVDLFLPLEAPQPHPSAPFGQTRARLTWRQLTLVGVAVAALVGASFYAERAARRSQEEAAVAAAEMRQKEKERVLAEESADRQRRQLEAAAAEQEAERVRAITARAELETAAQAKAAEAAEATKRAASWEQFYKPNPSCRTSWTIDCANAYIRAKRRFEEQTQ